MQLKKHNWKLLRHAVPCKLCGNETHSANACFVRGRSGRAKPYQVPRSYHTLYSIDHTTN
jgi:hypothetical protein